MPADPCAMRVSQSLPQLMTRQVRVRSIHGDRRNLPLTMRTAKRPVPPLPRVWPWRQAWPMPQVRLMPWGRSMWRALRGQARQRCRWRLRHAARPCRDRSRSAPPSRPMPCTAPARSRRWAHPPVRHSRPSRRRRRPPARNGRVLPRSRMPRCWTPARLVRPAGSSVAHGCVTGLLHPRYPSWRCVCVCRLPPGWSRWPPASWAPLPRRGGRPAARSALQRPSPRASPLSCPAFPPCAMPAIPLRDNPSRAGPRPARRHAACPARTPRRPRPWRARRAAPPDRSARPRAAAQRPCGASMPWLIITWKPCRICASRALSKAASAASRSRNTSRLLLARPPCWPHSR